MIPLTAEDKFQIYIHKTFGPPAVVLPALGAAYQMINPPSNYPRDWKDGAGAFGRNYYERRSKNRPQNAAGAALCGGVKVVHRGILVS
jgi:hypothetical protein